MCKILAMAGIKEDKRELAQRFMKVAAKELSTNDRDGFGYAAMTESGQLFGERWLLPADAFETRYEPGEREQTLIAKLQGAIVGGSPKYNSFGETAFGQMTACILHARMATCEKALFNTHPFVYEGHTALIHNGVLHHDKTAKYYTSTCDSEPMLNEYVEQGVQADPSAIQETVDLMLGSYACAVLSQDPQGVGYMDIFKNDRTGLNVSYVKELDCLVFCTTLYQLEQICRTMQLTIEFSYWVAPGALIRLNAKTGDVMTVEKFDHDDGKGGTGYGTTSLTHYKSAAKGAKGYTSTRSDDSPADDDDITEEKIKEMLEKNPHYGLY